MLAPFHPGWLLCSYGWPLGTHPIGLRRQPSPAAAQPQASVAVRDRFELPPDGEKEHADAGQSFSDSAVASLTFATPTFRPNVSL